MLIAHPCCVTCNCASSPGQLVIAGGMSGELYLWDVVTGEKVKSFKHHDGWWSFPHTLNACTLPPLIQSVLIHPDSSHNTGPIRCLAVSQDGRKIITGGDDKHIVIWSVPKSA